MAFKNALRLLPVIIALTMSPQLASAREGGSNGGGGANMESEVRSIAQNIADWIRSGRSAGLKLPDGVTTEAYNQGMLRELGSFSIEMVAEKLVFGGVTKTCVGEQVDPGIQTFVEPQYAKSGTITGPAVRNRVKCNLELFQITYKGDMEGLYRLIHHEFAGLARLEKNQEYYSDTFISDQVAQKIERFEIYRLPIDSFTDREDPAGMRTYLCAKNILVQSHEGEEENEVYGSYKSQVTPRDYVIWLLSNKNSFLWKALVKKGIIFKFGAEDGFGFSVGQPIALAGGGRVHEGYQKVIIPIERWEKRNTETAAHIVVRNDYNYYYAAGMAPAFTPNATESTMWTIESAYVPGERNSLIEFSTGLNPKDPRGLNEQLDSKVCRDVTIPKQNPKLNYELFYSQVF